MFRNLSKFRNKLFSSVMLLVLVVSQLSVFGDIDQEKVLTVGQRKVWYKDTQLGGSETGFAEFKINGRYAFCMDYRYSFPQTNIPVYSNRISNEALAVMKNGFPNVSAATLGLSSDEEAYAATQLAFWNVAGITGDADSYVKLSFSTISGANGHESQMARVLPVAQKIAADAFRNPYRCNASISVNANNADIKTVGDKYVAGPYKLNVVDTKISAYNVDLTMAPKSAYVTNAAGNITNKIGASDSFYIKWSAKENGQTIKYDISADGQKSIGSKYRTGKNGVQSIAFEEFEQISLRTSDQLTYNSAKGNIELIKIDQNKEKVQGALFELKDENGNIVGESTSDKNGVVRFSGLNVGTYTILEKVAPTGYVLDRKPISASVTAGATSKVTFINNKIYGKLKIVKTDDVDKAPLQGVTFQIQNADKVIVDTVTTDASGVAMSKNLPYGNYTYRETQVPSNIKLDGNSYPFSITSNGEIVTKNIVNTRIKGGIKIVKVDDFKAPIAGVKFEILNADRVLVDTLITDANGSANSKELVAGNYTYREVYAPSSVIMDTKEYSFNVTSTNLVEKYIINNRIKGNLKIVKTEDNNAPLKDVTFEILNKDRVVVDTITTNAIGIATSKYLSLGSYTYREISVPSGIVLDASEKTFNISSPNETVTKYIVNQRAKGQLKIIKVDDIANKIPGAKFEILNSSGAVVDTVTTNNLGEASSKYLPLGAYKFREISVPFGYVLDSTVRDFSLESNNQVVIKNVVNNRAKGQLKITKVDDLGAKLSGVKFEILDANKNVVDTIITNAEGVATSKYLPLGKYTFKEVEVPNGIVIDPSERPFDIKANNEVKAFKVINNRAMGKLKIVKVDEENKPLAGVVFEILDWNNKVVDTITTNANGEALTKALPIAPYTYREKSVPSGVILDTKEYEFALVNANKIVVKKIVNKYEKGSLKIVKTDDEKNPLSGVKFEILDSSKNVVDTIVTDKEGIAVSKLLKLGKYTYREIEVPNGIILDKTEKAFELTKNNQVITKKIVNEKIRGGLRVIKVDENTVPIAGVVFEILDSNNKVVDTITTDANGNALTKKLNTGAYSYKEISAPFGVIVDSATYPFNIEGDNIVEKHIVNKLAKGKLQISKFDDAENVLAGVKFEILDENKNVVDTLVTSSNGTVESKELKLGSYTYREIYVPNGYIIDSSEYPFELTKNNQVISKNIINIRAKGSLQIIKVDEKENKIAGVKFEIKDASGNLVEVLTTNTNGTCSSKMLPLGTYTYKEIYAPNGYVIDATEKEFKIDSANKPLVVKHVNKTAKGQIEIIKVDDSKNPLAGVKFEILDKNKNVVATLV
ncbi:MAG: SpaA isopeptide-forming pilin-related protein, partial [Clostridia bacterium]